MHRPWPTSTWECPFHSFSSVNCPILACKVFDVRTGLALVGRSGEYLSGALQQLGSPLADLVRVDLELFGELDQGPVSPDGSQGHFRFERR